MERFLLPGALLLAVAMLGPIARFVWLWARCAKRRHQEAMIYRAYFDGLITKAEIDTMLKQVDELALAAGTRPHVELECGVESYLDKYPEGTFASLARTRMEVAAQWAEGSPEPGAASSELSADSEAALELAFWESVKDGTPAELESYLDKYPAGTFASLARTRIAAAEHLAEGASDAPSAAAADELDLAFWNSVKDSRRREELQAYLDQHPNGHFAALARARLSSLEVA